MVVRVGACWQMRHGTDQLIVCLQKGLVLAHESV
jgi:hypothetical protein